MHIPVRFYTIDYFRPTANVYYTPLDQRHYMCAYFIVRAALASLYGQSIEDQAIFPECHRKIIVLDFPFLLSELQKLKENVEDIREYIQL